jgi:hypothetical protein
LFISGSLQVLHRVVDEPCPVPCQPKAVNLLVVDSRDRAPI